VDRVDAALLLLRLVVGGVLVVHGLNHAFGGGRLTGAARWFESLGLRHGMIQAAMSAIVEIGAGALLVLGLLTPVSAAAIVGVMVVAGIIAHRPNGFFIFKDGYEYVLVLGLSAVGIALAGPGSISLDALFGLSVSGAWALVIAAGLGVGGGAVLLLATYRPRREIGAE
jgi:putative oxidoreductase